jgi:hypothetical protein
LDFEVSRFREQVLPFRAAALRFLGWALQSLELVRRYPEPDLYCLECCAGPVRRFDQQFPDGPQPIRSRCFGP